MYTEFYQMTERPFNVTPDPKFLYLNARYREAIASLNYGISQRKGFITLIGEAGTGKTTLLKRLLEDLDPKTKTVFIFNTNVTFEEILEYIFAEFDLAVHNGKKLYMLQRLNTFLLEELRNGGNVALLIDEAQDLEFSVLEDLRLLSNLETAKEKILQIVLSGQPELGQKLSNPILRQLRQRISINCRLLPLSREEITEYLQFRLQAAGCPDLKLFSREAEDRIYHFSRGVPRLVNVVCDNALVIGYALGKKRIGADLIDEAAADLLPVELTEAETYEAAPTAVSAPSAVARPGGDAWRQRLAVGGLVGAAIGIGMFSVLRGGGDDGRGEAPAAPPVAGRDAGDVVAPGAAVPALPAVAAAAADAVPPTPAFEVRDPREDLQVAAVPPPPPAVPAVAAAAADPLAEPRPTAAAVVEPQPEAPLAVAAVAPEPVRPPEPRPAPPRAAEPEPEPEPRSEPPRRTARAPVAEPEPPRGAPRLDGVPFARVTVREGDSISGIAQRRYGQATATILDLLKLANPQLRDVDVIAAGQTLRLPQLTDGFPIIVDASGRYSLLVYTSAEAWRANGLRDALRAQGYQASVTRSSLGGGKAGHRVTLSGFASRDEVAAVGRSLQTLFRENAQIAQLTQ